MPIPILLLVIAFILHKIITRYPEYDFLPDKFKNQLTICSQIFKAFFLIFKITVILMFISITIGAIIGLYLKHKQG